MPRTQPATRRVRILLAGLLLGLAGVTGPAAQAEPAQAEPARYIVKLTDPPLAGYRGGIAGLLPTNPEVLGSVKLDVDSPASIAYLSYLAGRHHAGTAAMSTVLGRATPLLFDYRHAFNGFAVELTPAQAATVRGLPGVAEVQPDFERHLLTDAGPAWIGAPAIWDGTATAGAPGTRGEGVVVGVIDTGVNIDHPSFAGVGGDGYDHRNPRGRFYGLCDPLTGAPFCNDKLIGVHDFTATTPRDDNGHGSHTASTAAGNVVTAEATAPTTSLTRRISGVAPHANLITYKGCVVIGTCVGVSLVAAVDQAVADEVDVLNYSIGGGPSNPWDDVDAEAFLGARDAGVLAVVSAGNSGPGPGTVGSPANAPWVLSVGASTHDRTLHSSVAGLSGGATPPPGDILGGSLTAGLSAAPIVYAGDFGDPLCAGPFLPGTFHGEIVICDRGVNPRLEKGSNVRLGGAGGMVLANSETDGAAVVADAHELPAVAVGFTEGRELKQWVSTGTGHRGTLTATAISKSSADGDVLGGFSSRGPNLPAPDVIKPDVTAPGVDVLAAVHTTNPLAPPEFALLSGTSMAGPHVAGAAALVRAVHPDWTPAEVVSALTSTGRTIGLRKDDGKTPADAFDLGAGRVDLTQAARAGLVLGETMPDFLAANPAAEGDPAELNLATLAHQDCRGRCSWRREVTNTLSATTTWRTRATAPEGMTLTVQPDQLRLAPGETGLLTVTADVADLPSGNWAFGAVHLTPEQSTAGVQHLPVAVLPGGALQPVRLYTDTASGSAQVPVAAPVDVAELSSAVLGLQQGEITKRQLPQDPTLLDPYDGSPGTFHTTLQVPAGAPLLSAEVVDTTSADPDLFVGRDADGDGAPDAGEQVCASAGEAGAESCRLDNPQGGTYWVMVVNFLTGQVLDDVTLQTVVIPPVDNGNLTVSGPGGPVRAGSFPVVLRWHEPAMQPGSTWFALVRLSSRPDRDGDVGSLLVQLNRSS